MAVGGGQESLEGLEIEVVAGAQAAVEGEEVAEEGELLAVGGGTGGGREWGDKGLFVGRGVLSRRRRGTAR